MADTVVISGLDRKVPLWATEATMKQLNSGIQDILSLLEKKTGDLKSSSKNDTRKKQEQAKYQEQLNNATQDLEKSFRTNNQSLGKSTIATVGSFTKFIPAIGFAALGIRGFSDAIEKTIEFIENSLKSYTSIYDVGLQVTGGMLGLRIAASNAILPLDTFSHLLIDYSDTISTLGKDGAANFSLLQKGLVETTKGAGYFGLRLDQLAEYSLDYLEIQRKQGILSRMSEQEKLSGEADYIKNLTIFSQVMGKSRKQIDDEIKHFAGGPDVFATLSTLPDEIKKQALGSYQTVIGTFAGVTKNSGHAINEMFDTLVNTMNPNQSALYKVIAQTNPEVAAGFMTLAKNVREGAISEDDARKQSVKLVQSLQKDTNLVALKANIFAKDSIGDLAGGTEQLASVLSDISGISDDKLRALINGQVDEVDKNAKALLDFGVQIEKVKATFAVSFQQTLQNHQEVIQKVLDFFAESATYVAETLKNLLDPKTREATIKELKDGLTDIVKGAVEGLLDIIGNYVHDKIFAPDKKTPAPENISKEDFDKKASALATKAEELQKRAVAFQAEVDAAAAKEAAGSNTPATPTQATPPTAPATDTTQTVPPKQYAIGGIADKPSIFGDAGPEAAIPLSRNRMIPVARINFGNSLDGLAGRLNQNNDMVRMMQTKTLNSGSSLMDNIISAMPSQRQDESNKEIISLLQEQVDLTEEVVKYNQQLTDQINSMLNISSRSERNLKDTSRGIRDWNPAIK